MSNLGLRIKSKMSVADVRSSNRAKSLNYIQENNENTKIKKRRTVRKATNYIHLQIEKGVLFNDQQFISNTDKHHERLKKTLKNSKITIQNGLFWVLGAEVLDRGKNFVNDVRAINIKKKKVIKGSITGSKRYIDEKDDYKDGIDELVVY